MRKQNVVLIPLLAISVILTLGYKGFGWENTLRGSEVASILNQFNIYHSPEENQTWRVFQDYLAFAKVHNLVGVKSLSHQISLTCSDPSRETECFALMDSVYAFASGYKLSDFKHILSDERQIVMYTDEPVVVILYFVKDSNGTLKVLGMRFCFEDERTINTCVETDPNKRDLDGNGWWDKVESLFY